MYQKILEITTINAVWLWDSKDDLTAILGCLLQHGNVTAVSFSLHFGYILMSKNGCKMLLMH